MHSFKALFLTCLLKSAVVTSALEPAEVYDGGFGGNASIELRIGNGGAGQSGLVGALANEFIRSQAPDRFRVGWYKGDTTETINYLKSGDVDVGITYSPVAEKIAISQGIAEDPSYYAFRDHFWLVGPPENPANLEEDDDIIEMFSQLHAAAEEGANTDPPVKFLSRFDKSATNIKDSELWIKVGQVPWANPASSWYHEFSDYPIQALKEAAEKGEYTITDKGTYLSSESTVQDSVRRFKEGSDAADDPLLNPAHILVGSGAQDLDLATQFADWVVSEDGQKVITSFTKGGEQLYSGAP